MKLPYSIIDSGVLGRHTMNVVVISAVTGAMDAPLHFSSSSFFVPVGPCAGGNLHRDINVTVMFYPRAAMQNC